jgi:SH3-like domain-containing protein
MKKFVVILAAFAVVSLIAAVAQSSGSTMYVAVKKAEVRASTGFFTQVRGTLDMGSQVTVVQAGEKWTEIRSAGPALSGWIASAALTGRKVISSGHTVRAGEVAMAGKGFSGEIEQLYREGENLDYSSVDAMESFEVPPRDLYAFLAEGHLTTGE